MTYSANLLSPLKPDNSSIKIHSSPQTNLFGPSCLLCRSRISKSGSYLLNISSVNVMSGSKRAGTAKMPFSISRWFSKMARHWENSHAKLPCEENAPRASSFKPLSMMDTEAFKSSRRACLRPTVKFKMFWLKLCEMGCKDRPLHCWNPHSTSRHAAVGGLLLHVQGSTWQKKSKLVPASVRGADTCRSQGVQAGCTTL